MTVLELLTGAGVTDFGFVYYGELASRYGKPELATIYGFYTKYSNGVTVIITGGGAGGTDLISCWVLDDTGTVIWEDERSA